MSLRAPTSLSSDIYNRQGHYTFRYNVFNLNYKKWRNHTSSSSFRFSSLGGGTTSVGVNVGEGDFVIFCLRGTFIDAFLMSQGYSLRHLKPPELAKDIVVLSPDEFGPAEQCRFVHLGGRRICLGLSRFMGPLTGNYLAEFEKMSVFCGGI